MVRDSGPDEKSNTILNNGGGEHPSHRDKNRVKRRKYLQLIAASAVSGVTITAQTGVVQAEKYRYGEGGYGEGAYGGGGFSVVTQDPTDIDTTSVTLTGELSNLDGANSADCYFEWRQDGVDSWNTTTTQTLNEAGTFSDSLSGLEKNAGYEFRALGDASDDSSDTGDTVSFTTNRNDSLPVIDRFSVSEADSPDSYAEVTVVWEVTDADGDLASVNIDIADSIKGLTRTLGGTNASDEDSFRIKESDGQTFDVTLTVTDRAGNSTSKTKSVTA